MTIKNIFKSLAVAFLLTHAPEIDAQRAILIQQFTITSNGTTDTVDCMPLVIDTLGNVTVATNNRISASQYDATTAQILSNGASNWINSFSSPTNQKAFITASCQDASGNVFVCGGVRTSATNGLDMFVLGYDVGGTQIFSGYYNGPASLTDVGAAICVDNNDHVYVTGPSDGLLAGVTDYATIAFKISTQTQVWANRYDYSYYMDVPTGITFDGLSSSVYVTGGSGTSLTNFDIATVRYKAVDGTQQSVNRSVYAGSGFDMPFGMVTDAEGNMYIAGRVYNNGTGNYDCNVQKLDTSLATIWSQPYDGNGSDDLGVGIALDAHNNVLVTGTSLRQNGTKEMFVLKYSPSGVGHHSFVNGKLGNSEGLKLSIGANDDIFVAGQYGAGSAQDVVVLVLDSTCKTIGEKVFNSSYNLADKLMDIAITSDKIHLSVRSNNGADDNNLVVTYSYRELIYTTATHPTTGLPHIDQAVIVKFSKSALKMAAINDKKILYGKVGDFVNDSTVEKMSNLVEAYAKKKYDVGDFDARKIYYNLNEDDSLSESRLGTMIEVPDFYTTLLIELPSVVDEVYMADNLSSIFPDVSYSLVDGVSQLHSFPNDPHYLADQTSLHPYSPYLDAHINVEKAWNRSRGKSFVRLGVYDSGVLLNHPDVTPVEEYSYYSGSPAWQDAAEHGSGVAGIPCAKTHNGIGVAGIAGGDSLSSGASLVNIKVFDLNYTAPWSVIGPAYVDGASGQNLPSGKGLHIMNSSFGRKEWKNKYLSDGINYCNRNGVAFIAARGNWKSTDPFAVNAPSIPATIRPGVVMNVGASGTDGHYHKAGLNGTVFDSMDSLDVDFVAPGDILNVYTTAISVGIAPWANVASSTTFYGQFGGTSASAPHVAGVAALMMSYRNHPVSNWDNIVHEDVEALLKRTATDLDDFTTYGETVGADIKTGYGRINADSALIALDSIYAIRHIDRTHYSSSSSIATSVIYTGDTLVVPTNGKFIVNTVEVTETLNYNYSNDTYLDSWPLFCISNGHHDYHNNDTVDDTQPGYVNLVSANLTTAVLKTYVYQYTHQIIGATAFPASGYYPTSPSNINCGFSLYSIGNQTYAGIKTEDIEVRSFDVYPNPNNGVFNVSFRTKSGGVSLLNLTDITGRVLFSDSYNSFPGLNHKDLTISHLPKGIYFLTLKKDNSKQLVKKLIIE